MKSIQLAKLLVLGLLAIGTHTNAKELPKWELGIGVGGLHANSYRGSDETSDYLVPIPYFGYRGEDLRITSDGLNAKIFAADSVELGLSLRGSIPVKSDDTDAREGMPDLLPIIEVGPSLNWEIFRRENYRLRLLAPLRAAIATDLSEAEGIGWVFSPTLNVDMPQRYSAWTYGLSLGVLYSSDEYNEYIYGVAPRYATALRPSYKADSGFGGYTSSASLIWREPGYWIGAYFQYDRLDGAAFEDSPLVEQDDYFLVGLAVTWVFHKSKETIGKSVYWR